MKYILILFFLFYQSDNLSLEQKKLSNFLINYFDLQNNKNYYFVNGLVDVFLSKEHTIIGIKDHKIYKNENKLTIVDDNPPPLSKPIIDSTGLLKQIYISIQRIDTNCFIRNIDYLKRNKKFYIITPNEINDKIKKKEQIILIFNIIFYKLFGNYYYFRYDIANNYSNELFSNSIIVQVSDNGYKKYIKW